MAWQNDSIMARKGVAKGERGKQYTITESEQGKYHYVYGPYVKPVLTVDPGAVVSAETHDAFEGAIKYETDSPSKILNFPFQIRPFFGLRNGKLRILYGLSVSYLIAASNASLVSA